MAPERPSGQREATNRVRAVRGGYVSSSIPGPFGTATAYCSRISRGMRATDRSGGFNGFSIQIGHMCIEKPMKSEKRNARPPDNNDHTPCFSGLGLGVDPYASSRTPGSFGTSTAYCLRISRGIMARTAWFVASRTTGAAAPSRCARHQFGAVTHQRSPGTSPGK